MGTKAMRKRESFKLGVKDGGVKSRGQRKREEKKLRLKSRRALGGSVKAKDRVLPDALKENPSQKFYFGGLKSVLEEVEEEGKDGSQKNNYPPQWHTGGSQRGLKRAIAVEREQIQSVLSHEIYKANPINALRAHLNATVGSAGSTNSQNIAHRKPRKSTTTLAGPKSVSKTRAGTAKHGSSINKAQPLALKQKKRKKN